jgi:phage-related minor tail protein
VFDEPFGVSVSNEPTDNVEDPIFAEISEIKITHDPLRKTTRTTIAKPSPRKITKASLIAIKSKSAVQDSEDEAEKRRERVRKCRRKKKEQKEEDLLKKEALVADNSQREDNIARMNQQLAQLNEIVAAHNRAQPDAAASLLSSLLEELSSQPDVSTVLSSFF